MSRKTVLKPIRYYSQSSVSVSMVRLVSYDKQITTIALWNSALSNRLNTCLSLITLNNSPPNNWAICNSWRYWRISLLTLIIMKSHLNHRTLKLINLTLTISTNNPMNSAFSHRNSFPLHNNWHKLNKNCSQQSCSPKPTLSWSKSLLIISRYITSKSSLITKLTQLNP